MAPVGVAGEPPRRSPWVWFVAAAAFVVLALASFALPTSLEIPPTRTVELSEGDEFDLGADRPTTCTVTPQNGEQRELQARTTKRTTTGRKGRTRTTSDDADYVAWFSGPAEISCAGPAEYEGPDEETMENIAFGMFAVGLVGAVICGWIGYRRIRPKQKP
ncbi:MAG TPA: hypothetical protein VIL00_04935 [Pseudonocardiaceae bacterium]